MPRFFSFDIDFPLLDSWRKPKPLEAPAELRAVTPEELVDMLESARHFALKVTRSRPDSERVVQDAIKLLYTKRRWKEARGPLKPHFMSITMRVMQDDRRKLAKEIGVYDVYEKEGNHTRSAAASAEDIALQREDIEGKLEWLRKIEAKLGARGVVVLHNMVDRKETPDELAKRLGVPRRKIYAIEEKIKRWAANHDIDNDDVEHDGDEKDEGFNEDV